MRELSLDWLSFTYIPECIRLASDDIEGDLDIVDLFIRDFPELRDIVLEHMVNVGGKMHYNTCLKFNDDFLLLYNDLDKPVDDHALSHLARMGLNFIVPSHSLDLFFDLFDVNRSDVSGMIKILYNRSCQLSRIDLCYDDYDKKYRPLDYARFWFDDRIKSHFQTMDIKGTGKDIGNTFYLGSLKKRTKVLRIYDKDYESNGEKDCVRYEFELHAEYARDMAQYLIEHETLDFISYLRSWFEVLVAHCNNTNKSCVSVLSEWIDYFSQSVFSEKIVVPRYNDKDRNKLITRFIEKQVLPSLKGYVALYGWNYVKNILDDVSMNSNYEGYIKSLDFRGLLFKPCLHSPFEDI